MNRKEALRQTHQKNTLENLGFSTQQADTLRRISMTLRRWHELECGIDGGCVERDSDGKTYWKNEHSGRRAPIADRETGALKRLENIIKSRNILRADDPLNFYIQGDPRGAALYILRPQDIPEGKDVNAYYTRGICVY